MVKKMSKNTDTVPAMLTPGEVVLNAKQQKALGELLGMSSSDVFKKIGVPGFQNGGKVSTLEKIYRDRATQPPKNKGLRATPITNDIVSFVDAQGDTVSQKKVVRKPTSPWEMHLKNMGGESKYFKNESEFNKARQNFKDKYTKPKKLQYGGIVNTPIVEPLKDRKATFLSEVGKTKKMAGGGKVGKPKRSDIYRGIYLAKMRKR